MFGSYERYSALPNKMRMIIDIGVVKIEQGFDGRKGWISQGRGPQPMPDDQAKQMSEANPQGAVFLDPSRFAKAEVVGKESFDGAEAYIVVVTSKSGEESAEFFDVTSGLRIGTVNKTPMGGVRRAQRLRMRPAIATPLSHACSTSLVALAPPVAKSPAAPMPRGASHTQVTSSPCSTRAYRHR